MAAVQSSDRERRTRRARWPLAVAALIVLGGASVRSARAQADLRDITQPIPVVNTGGHSAPVRSLIFASRDGSQLLSAGMDKIINVWNLGEAPPGLARTIRPRIWRGYAGAIHAMALSPTPDRDGQRTLAVAGFGVQSTRGEIGLFRFPGLNSRPTGDVRGAAPERRARREGTAGPSQQRDVPGLRPPGRVPLLREQSTRRLGSGTSRRAGRWPCSRGTPGRSTRSRIAPTAVASSPRGPMDSSCSGTWIGACDWTSPGPTLAASAGGSRGRRDQRAGPQPRRPLGGHRPRERRPDPLRRGRPAATRPSCPGGASPGGRRGAWRSAPTARSS